MYLDFHKRECYVIDIETESLTPSIIHVMCWKNVKTGETGECIGLDEIRAFFANTKGALFVGHNVLKFDAPVISRLSGVRLSVGSLIDTLVLSTLYSPSLSGGHSLDAWGERLGKEKIKFSEWSRLSLEMIEYCHRDVEITCELFLRLIKVLDKIGFSEKSIEIQHRFTVILDRQSRNGFYFDGQRALGFLSDLRTRQSELEETIHGVFPPERLLVREGKTTTKTGRPTAIFLKDRDRYSIELSSNASYMAFEDMPFNIGSPKQRVEKLVGLGWQAREFTEAGTPTPFIKGKLAPSLEQFLEDHDVPEVELIARWMSINGRASMVSNWIDNWNEDTGCIHGKLFVADTLRLRHQAPNTSNIPAVRLKTFNKGTSEEYDQILYGEDGYYTYEARDLWTARPGRVLVGTDGKSLEYRLLAHHVNNPELIKVVLTSDVHVNTQLLAGLDTKAKGKTLNFALVYGGQDKKIGSIVGGSKAEGARLRKLIYDKIPGLGDAIEESKAEFRRGRIDLIDGSKLICPSEHAAFNYKLQGGGARVMAQGAIFLADHIRREGLDSLKVGDIHDEWQHDVDPKDAKRHAELANQSLREAGEELNMNLPMEGESKEGLTWAQTH